MNTQQTSRSIIVIHRISGVIASIFGYFIDFLFGGALLFGHPKSAGIVVVLLVFITIGTCLIVYGIKTKRKIQRFRKYVSIISLESETSLGNIASASSQSLDFVTKDLQKMINQKFFINAYIDKNTNEIILQKKNAVYSENTTLSKDEHIETKAVTCKGCGASNNITVGITSECEFCGSAIN